MKSPVRIFWGGKAFQTGPGEEIAQIDAQEASGKSYHLIGGRTVRDGLKLGPLRPADSADLYGAPRATEE
jgi:hypothetical protein